MTQNLPPSWPSLSITTASLLLLHFYLLSLLLGLRFSDEAQGFTPARPVLCQVGHIPGSAPSSSPGSFLQGTLPFPHRKLNWAGPSSGSWSLGTSKPLPQSSQLRPEASTHHHSIKAPSLLIGFLGGLWKPEGLGLRSQPISIGSCCPCCKQTWTLLSHPPGKSPALRALVDCCSLCRGGPDPGLSGAAALLPANHGGGSPLLSAAFPPPSHRCHFLHQHISMH